MYERSLVVGGKPKKKERKNMRADEYVVEELLKARNELNEIKAANIFLREDIKELEKKYKVIKDLFYLEETSSKQGYRLCVKGIGICADSIVASEWTKNIEDFSKDFINIVAALGLEIPVEEPNAEELENDPELVEQALEKAKELQSKKESENE